MNWYSKQKYSQCYFTENECKIAARYLQEDKIVVTSGFFDNINMSAILLAVSLVLGGENIAEATQKAERAHNTKIDRNVVEKAVKNNKVVNLIKKRKNTNQTPAKKNSPKQRDLSLDEIIARTLYAEAADQSEDGKRAIASVILNRANKNVDRIKDVIKAPKQFSCWNNITPKEGKGNAWDDCLKIAKEIVSGVFVSTTTADHYYNPNKCNPPWAKGKKSTKIGDHNFLKLN